MRSVVFALSVLLVIQLARSMNLNQRLPAVIQEMNKYDVTSTQQDITVDVVMPHAQVFNGPVTGLGDAKSKQRIAVQIKNIEDALSKGAGKRHRREAIDIALNAARAFDGAFETFKDYDIFFEY
ncbi:unnamed protein product [Caenorhabditis auriculariae]|uniref:Uncharacterized protein n=1 Tax=Caenorhabditis auriculariae TaxID=2777116 RepID=A0A8S1HGA7_9PELO|nr:unnamed protein product [Caenorhabditis auriculariae]